MRSRVNITFSISHILTTNQLSAYLTYSANMSPSSWIHAFTRSKEMSQYCLENELSAFLTIYLTSTSNDHTSSTWCRKTDCESIFQVIAKEERDGPRHRISARNTACQSPGRIWSAVLPEHFCVTPFCRKFIGSKFLMISGMAKSKR